MAQTTGSMSWKDASVYYSTNTTTYTDISGYATLVTESGGDRATSEAHTMEGDTPLIGTGKRSAKKILFTIVYTDATTDAWNVLRACYEATGGTPISLRWKPRAQTTGLSTTNIFTTDLAPLTEFHYPSGDANSAAVLVAQIGTLTPKVTTTTSTT